LIATQTLSVGQGAFSLSVSLLITADLNFWQRRRAGPERLRRRADDCRDVPGRMAHPGHALMAAFFREPISGAPSDCQPQPISEVRQHRQTTGRLQPPWQQCGSHHHDNATGAS